MTLWSRLSHRWRQVRESRALTRRAIPDELWLTTVAQLPFLAQRCESDLTELRRLASLFLDEKEFHGAGGLVVDDAIAVSIAAQACLPVLRMGLAPYRSFVGIVVHPDEVVAQREWTDEHGIVHQWQEQLSGEAMQGGPVMLSWRDVGAAGESAAWAYNVVIHEFAHVLDMADGLANGLPPLPPGIEREEWVRLIEDEYAHFRTAVDMGRPTLLDPYGASGIDEFFAVASEAFFVTADDLRQQHPELYEMLARYFGQDPACDAQQNAR